MYTHKLAKIDYRQFENKKKNVNIYRINQQLYSKKKNTQLLTVPHFTHGTFSQSGK